MIRNMPLAFGALMLVFTNVLAAIPPELKRDVEDGNQAWVVGLRMGDARIS
jgi:hypothetical protein